MRKPTATSETSMRILDIAERLVQTRGFNAFSYADVAGTLHITKASLHYHFPTKAKLGERLVERYRTSFLGALEQIDATCRDAGAKLRAYVSIYTNVLQRNRMCLCGMLSADYATLPKAMKDEVRRFFEANESWLTDVLRHGRDNNQLAFSGPPVEAARVLIAALEGAMLLARAQGDAARLQSAANRLLGNLGVATSVAGKAAAKAAGS